MVAENGAAARAPRMRLLWVKAGKILPVNTGGRIRSYNILRHLAARHDVTFLSYYDGERDMAYEQELARQFPGAIVMPSGRGSSASAQAMAYAGHLASSAPFSVAKFTTPAVRDAVNIAIAQRKPDVAVCDFLSASLTFTEPLAVPTVLFQHNVESALWNRQAKHERSVIKRLVFRLEAARMRRYEAAAVRRFAHVIAVSEHDRSLMSAMRPASDISVVPTGVDVESFRADGADPDAGSVMFLGSMDWPANIDGVDFFANQVWPLVLERVPGAQFNVVGRNPPHRIADLASSSVHIVGGVDSVLPHLHRAAVFVVPLRIGGGTRLKIYEAMAAGRAIVSTRVGAEGLDYTAGADILIEDEPERFASAVVRLLTDDTTRGSVGAAALATAARFDWSAVAEDFASVLDGARRVAR